MILDEIAAYLQASQVGTVGTDIFKGRLPDTPDTLLAVHEYAGPAPLFTHDGEQPLIENPRVQVRARSASYETVRQLIEKAYNALNRVKNQSLSSVRYLRVMPLQQPFYFGRDANERVEFVFNVQIMKQPSQVA